MSTADEEKTIDSAIKEKTVFNTIQSNNSRDILINDDTPTKDPVSWWKVFVFAYQSIGIVYGDLGTSPLYTFSSTFTSAPTREDLLGTLSIIIWTLTLLIVGKYCVFVLQADDNGEGGTFALYSLLSRYARINWNDPRAPNRNGLKRHATGDIRRLNRDFRSWLEDSRLLRQLISFLAILGVCMVLADGVLTPAQTVLGAIQGLSVQVPSINLSAQVGISVAILILIFAMQPLGTSKIGYLFAPIVATWLVLNFALGIYDVVHYDASMFAAFNPYWIYYLFAHRGRQAWEMLGGTLLSVTGVEALFADMGHFTAMSIRISWTCFAYPCLLMAYIGQAAYLSYDTTGQAWASAFYASVPPQAFWFTFVMAILAAIVASQAMISGCFSILSQAMALSNFPQLKVVHTSETHRGQIYIPAANWILMIATVAVAAGFQSTTALGNAYGACVITTAFITTILMTLVTIIVWRWPVPLAILFFLFFGFIEGAYLTSTLRKVPDGAWFTFAAAAVLALIMCIWRYGTIRQWTYEDKLSQAQSESMLLPHSRFPGVLVVFDPVGFDIPTAYQHLRHVFHVQPAVVIFCHLRKVNVPNVKEEERMIVFHSNASSPDTLAYRVVLRQGYNDQGQLPMELGDYLCNRILELLEEDDGGHSQPQQEEADSHKQEEIGSQKKIIETARQYKIAYLSNTVNVSADDKTSNFLKRLVIKIYGFLHRNTVENRQEMFNVPVQQIIQIGMHYKL